MFQFFDLKLAFFERVLVMLYPIARHMSNCRISSIYLLEELSIIDIQQTVLL